MKRVFFVIAFLCFLTHTYSQHVVVLDSAWMFVSEDGDTCYEAITERHPKTEKTFKKAEAFFKKGKLEKAKELYDKAVEMDPKYYDAIMARAEFHEASGALDLAIKEYTLAIKMLPCEKKPHLERGRVHLTQEHWGSAIQDFQAYLKWSTINAEIYPMMATAMFATKNDAAACKFLEKGIKLDDDVSQKMFDERCK
ncbi:MAG: tetratricopeptide repeat protein [Flavobacteriales bacterium]|nr:tetratricopeptide repeat protein [Flavobacteriales bacterium]